MMKHALLVLILFFPMVGFCQDEKFDIGFYLEYTNRQNSLSTQNSHFQSIKSENSSGFGFGFNTYYRINNGLRFRLSPGLIFEKDILMFSNQTNEEKLQYDLMLIQFPIHGLISISKNYPLQVVTGLTYYFQRSTQENDPIELYRLKKSDLSADIGLAYSLAVKTITITPELKYSFGLLNLAGNGEEKYEASIDDFTRSRFTLALYFSNK